MVLDLGGRRTSEPAHMGFVDDAVFEWVVERRVAFPIEVVFDNDALWHAAVVGFFGK